MENDFTSEEMKQMYCPVLKKEIDCDICFDISMVAERMAPKWSAPEEIYSVEGYEEICLECKNHPD